MGERTTISGHIQEAWYVPGTGPRGDDGILRRLGEENAWAISRLPEVDTWPFLCRGMFARSPAADDVHPSPNGTFRGRVIYFGGSYSKLWTHWPAWLEKFEGLLTQLFWEHAALVMVTETMGTFHYEWSVSVDSSNRFGESPPVPPRTWKFEGGPRVF